MDNAKRMVYAEDVLARLKRDKAYMSEVGYIHARSAVNSAPTIDVKHGTWKLEPHSFYRDNWDESIELCIYITASCSECGGRHPNRYEVHSKNLYAPDDATEDFRFDQEAEKELAISEYLTNRRAGRDFGLANFCPNCGIDMREVEND